MDYTFQVLPKVPQCRDGFLNQHKENCFIAAAAAAAAKSLHVSDSVRPHRRQPTRLCRPWDFSGKNTGEGCHCLLQCMKVKSESEVAQLCPSLHDPMDCSPPSSSVHGIFQARVLEWVAIFLLHTNSVLDLIALFAFIPLTPGT